MVLTSTEFRDQLRRFPATKLATRCGVSTKSLYRYRDGKTTPSLETYEKILSAMRQMEALGLTKESA